MNRAMVESRIIELIDEAEIVVASCHMHGDGDGVGSLLGLLIVLKESGKDIRGSLPDNESIPPQYRFLPGQELLVPPSSLPEEPQLFMALDCGNIGRLGDLQEVARRAQALVNIDHHEDNTYFGDINLVDFNASCTAEILFELLKKKYVISGDAATCLYTGLITDTGRFKHGYTNSKSFRLAAELLELGVDPVEVAHQVYENASLGYLRLMGLVLERASKLEDLPVVYSYFTQEDLKKHGISMEETEDLIEMIRLARDAKVAVLLKEQPDGRTRISLRSRDELKVGDIARKFGGGGHMQAAGFTSSLSLEQILQDIGDSLKGQVG